MAASQAVCERLQSAKVIKTKKSCLFQTRKMSYAGPDLSQEFNAEMDYYQQIKNCERKLSAIPKLQKSSSKQSLK